jgi:hypothetical protein
MHGIHIEKSKGVAKEFTMGNVTEDTRKARGFCISCNEVPAMRGKTRCLHCAIVYSNRSKAHYLRKKAMRPTRVGNLGIVKMSARDMKELRWQTFERSDGRCEIIWNAERCPNLFGWSNFHLHHEPRGASRSDTPETTKAACIPCHKKLHPGPQWGTRIA